MTKTNPKRDLKNQKISVTVEDAENLAGVIYPEKHLVQTVSQVSPTKPLLMREQFSCCSTGWRKKKTSQFF